MALTRWTFVSNTGVGCHFFLQGIFLTIFNQHFVNDQPSVGCPVGFYRLFDELPDMEMGFAGPPIVVSPRSS